jgi:hypothetical protein
MSFPLFRSVLIPSDSNPIYGFFFFIIFVYSDKRIFPSPA